MIEAKRLEKLVDAGDFITHPAICYRGTDSLYYDGFKGIDK